VALLLRGLGERALRHAPVAGILLAALALRLIGLGDHDLWFDEALEVERDRFAWPRILLFTGGPDPPLFRLLMSPVARATSSEVWLRMPSVLLSTATVGLVWCWLVRLGDRRLALLAAALLAVAPVQVYYAQEVSQYALASFVAVALLLATQIAFDRGTARDWVILCGAAVIAVTSYYGLVFLAGAVDLVLLWNAWRSPRRSRARRGALVFTVVLALVLGLVWWALLAEQTRRFRSDALYAPLAEHSIGALLALLASKLETDFVRFFWMPWSNLAPRALTFLPAALAVLGIVALARRGARWRVPLLICAAATIAMGGAYALGRYPFGLRYAFFLSPFLFVFVAQGVLSLARWPAVAVAAAALAIFTQVAFLPNLRVVPNPWVAPPYENLGRVLSWVEKRRSAGEPIYLYYGARPAFRIYRARTRAPVVWGTMLRGRSAAEKAASVRRAMAEKPRFFLVVSHPWRDERQEIVEGLTGGARPSHRIVDAIEERGAYAALVEEVAAPAGP